MRLKERVKLLKREALTLWIAERDPRTPLVAKLLAGAVAAYAFSPIDLIPDFIPVLGYLDDVILLPVLIWATVRMLPAEVLADSRAKAEEWMTASAAKPRSIAGAIGIVVIWLVVGAVLSMWMMQALE